MIKKIDNHSFLWYHNNVDRAKLKSSRLFFLFILEPKCWLFFYVQDKITTQQYLYSNMHDQREAVKDKRIFYLARLLHIVC